MSLLKKNRFWMLESINFEPKLSPTILSKKLYYAYEEYCLISI